MSGVCPVIAGPTAVGKTALVVALAARHPVEVVSLDSRQIYRGLRIGTAQPTAEELAACPHHLVDFLPPTETYSAQRFRDDFTRVYADIRARGAVPILVGGAGMYLTALQEGFFPVPADAPDLDALRAELEALDDAALDTALRAVDPDSAVRLHPNDRYRRQRALEIHRLTGRPFSVIRAEQTPDPVLGLAFPTVVLERDPEALRARIAARTELMLRSGWVEETMALLKIHAPDAPGLRTLGYREITEHLRDGVSLDATTDTIVTATARYAKRQRTWFRPRPAVHRGAPEDPRTLKVLLSLVETAAAP